MISTWTGFTMVKKHRLSGGIRVRSYKKPKIIQAPHGISSVIVVVSNNHEKDKYVVPWEPAEFNESDRPINL